MGDVQARELLDVGKLGSALFASVPRECLDNPLLCFGPKARKLAETMFSSRAL
jgi:hypothetical protein